MLSAGRLALVEFAATHLYQYDERAGNNIQRELECR